MWVEWENNFFKGHKSTAEDEIQDQAGKGSSFLYNKGNSEAFVTGSWKKWRQDGRKVQGDISYWGWGKKCQVTALRQTDVCS